MLREGTGRCRPIERLVCSMGAEIVPGDGLTEGHFYVAGGRLLILSPSWATGRAMREAVIARQAVLVAIAALGEAGALAAFRAAVDGLRGGMAAD
jgi:alkyl hydroperoxide reductase subunit AhpF